ncbi:LysE family translocator [Gynuella sunshinyii]|uniref:Putative threonine efflux protein n=1 Tax=Gynuella sunshinyii YC6258 TaxID=1445510 RepID=A0A0C5VP50_9GAMM|nr:LysE family translocator [Gynuella sunshinyii]AJQ96056.1 putative threonine efflux protein [Gynuella sunshinyii YC6258]
MHGYIIFLLIALITVLSPGPGVLLTLTNALRFGVSGAIAGILGIAVSTFIVAGIAATGLAVVLATSSLAFMVIKYIGAAYLIFLGIKLWRSPAIQPDTSAVRYKSISAGFIEGFTLQLTNPKAVFFFISVFPQFVDRESAFLGQFLLLVTTYSSLVVIVHICYAFLAKAARTWFSTASNSRIVNRLGGSVFVAFGFGLASASR